MHPHYETAAELVASVRTLLTLPDVYLRVKAVVEDPDAYLDDLVNAVMVDPGISARLLRLVNSAYLNLATPVDNIRRAVNILGMRPVHDLVLATTVTSAFARLKSGTLDLRRFWELSVLRAVYARLIAIRCGLLDRDRPFVAGLLSDIGHQIMYLRLPDQSEAARRHAQTGATALADIETELLGYNYADVGGELMRAWRMPASLTESVDCHTRPERARQFQMDTAVVHIANVLTALEGSDLDHQGVADAVAPIAWQTTGLGPQDLEALPARAAIELPQTIGALVPNSTAA